MIGVCIKYFHENYGGMLQAYATVSMLEERGIDYELIQYEKSLSIQQKFKSIPRLLNGTLLNDKYEAIKKKIGLKKHPEFARNEAIRMKAFEEFKKELTEYYSSVKLPDDELGRLAKTLTSMSSGITLDILEKYHKEFIEK